MGGSGGKSLVLKDVLCIEMLVGNELQSQGWLLASVCVAFPFLQDGGHQSLSGEAASQSWQLFGINCPDFSSLP